MAHLHSQFLLIRLRQNHTKPRQEPRPNHVLTARLDVSDFENILLDDITLSTIGNAHDGAVASLALYRADGVSGHGYGKESIIFNTNGTVPGFARWQFSGTNRVTLTKGTATFLVRSDVYA